MNVPYASVSDLLPATQVRTLCVMRSFVLSCSIFLSCPSSVGSVANNDALWLLSEQESHRLSSPIDRSHSQLMSALNSQPGADYGTAKQQFLKALRSSLPDDLGPLLDGSAVGRVAEELRVQV